MKGKLSFLPLCFCLMLVASCLAITTAAADLTENEAVLLENSCVDLSECELLSTQTYNVFLNDDGSVAEVIEGQLPSVYANRDEWAMSYFTATLYFYQTGSHYYVTMEADTVSNNYWFVKHEFKIRPKNNSNWFTHTYPHESNPPSISDVISFHYPNGAPSNVTVEVKGYFSIRGDLLFNWSWPDTVLDNPD